MSNSIQNPPVSNDHPIDSHPTLRIKENATSDDLVEEIEHILNEASMQMIVLQCALDSDHGAPAGDVAASFVYFLQRRLELLRNHVSRLTENAIAQPPFRKN